MATKAELIYTADWVNLEKKGREFSLSSDISERLENFPRVIDNTNSTSATDALSANMGKVLQDQINEFTGVGTFLSLWDCSTWLPETDPTTNPYKYKVWNYYIVSKVAEEWNPNYRPRWTQYNSWEASRVEETEDVKVNDWYIYDWARWIRQPNGWTEIAIDWALSPSSKNAVENRVVTNALNNKQDTINDLETIRQWAAKWNTAIQPWDNISELENNVWYQTEWDVVAKLTDYYTKDEIDEKENWYVKFWDNQVDNIEIYMSDANWNYIEFYPNSFYVENENGDAENYDFFWDYRLARLNETMRLFPLPERWDDITHIANIIKRWETVYFYQKDWAYHNIWVVASMDGAYIRSYMNTKWQYLNVLINWDDSEVISDGWFIEDARLVYQDSYTWHFLPDNNTWRWEYFSVHKTTNSSFTVNTSWTFSMWFEYKLKVNNSWSNTITVTLWNNLLNPRNIPTTVEAWKEVIFLFYSSTGTVRNLELAQRIEYPFGWEWGGDTVFFPFPNEWDDVSDLIDALNEGKYVVLTLWEDDREFYAIYDYLQGSEFSIYIPWAKDNCTFMLDWTEIFEVVHNRDNSVPWSALNWMNLPSNNTMNQTNVWFFKTVSANFTLHATADPNKRAIEKYFKAKNNWANDITVTLWNNIDNPFNVDTTVKAGKEVVFVFHSNSNNPRWSIWDRIDWTNYSSLIDALQWDVATLESDVATLNDDVADLQDNKADKSDTYTKAEVDSAIAWVGGLDLEFIEKVDFSPTSMSHYTELPTYNYPTYMIAFYDMSSDTVGIAIQTKNSLWAIYPAYPTNNYIYWGGAHNTVVPANMASRIYVSASSWTASVYIYKINLPTTP